MRLFNSQDRSIGTNCSKFESLSLLIPVIVFLIDSSIVKVKHCHFILCNNKQIKHSTLIFELGENIGDSYSVAK